VLEHQLILRLRSSRSSLSGILATFLPPISSSPDVGSTRRLSIRSTVDFPEPDKPMITKNSPGATSKLTSSAAAFGFFSDSDRLLPNQPDRDDAAPPRGP
jgi:hypothetical protein